MAIDQLMKGASRASALQDIISHMDQLEAAHPEGDFEIEFDQDGDHIEVCRECGEGEDHPDHEEGAEHEGAHEYAAGGAVEGDAGQEEEGKQASAIDEGFPDEGQPPKPRLGQQAWRGMSPERGARDPEDLESEEEEEDVGYARGGQAYAKGGKVGFAKLERSLAHKEGVTDPAALAASIGRKKYGKKSFQQHAAAGKKFAKGGEARFNPKEGSDRYNLAEMEEDGDELPSERVEPGSLTAPGQDAQDEQRGDNDARRRRLAKALGLSSKKPGGNLKGTKDTGDGVDYAKGGLAYAKGGRVSKKR